MDYFTMEPRPFISTSRKVAVSWAPKSACSHVALWFYLQEGLLRAATFYHPFPHRYRNQVYYQSMGFQRRKAEFLADDLTDWTLIKVVRDPVKRMVASFRHAVQNPLMDDLLAPDPMAQGVSLMDYGNALFGLDLTYGKGVDMHVCRQQHPIWDAPFGRVITINADTGNLNADLNSAARKTGLRQVEFDRVNDFKRIRRTHYAEDVPMECPDLFNFRFRRGEWSGQFPKSALLALPDTTALGNTLYGDDYALVSATPKVA